MTVLELLERLKDVDFNDRVFLSVPQAESREWDFDPGPRQFTEIVGVEFASVELPVNPYTGQATESESGPRNAVVIRRS